MLDGTLKFPVKYTAEAKSVTVFFNQTSDTELYSNSKFWNRFFTFPAFHIYAKYHIES